MPTRTAPRGLYPAGSLEEALRRWRAATARERDLPPFAMFTNADLERIAAWEPTTVKALARIRQVPRATVEQHGGDIVAVARRYTASSRAARSQAGAARAEQPLDEDAVQALRRALGMLGEGFAARLTPEVADGLRGTSGLTVSGLIEVVRVLAEEVAEGRRPAGG
jgi:ribonuclease D